MCARGHLCVATHHSGPGGYKPHCIGSKQVDGSSTHASEPTTLQYRIFACSHPQVPLHALLPVPTFWAALTHPFVVIPVPVNAVLVHSELVGVTQGGLEELIVHLCTQEQGGH